MWPDRISNLGPLALESDALRTARTTRPSYRSVVLVSRVSMGDIIISMIVTMWQFLNLFQV